VTTDALDDAATRISRFLIAQALINFCYGALVASGLWIIDLTLGGGRNGLATALLAGVLCGVLRFVPYVGPWIGAALPLGLAFAAFPGNSVFLVTLAMFVGIELVVSQAVEPHLIGSSTGISPVSVLVATVFWTWLWGPIGLLLSTPITVLLVVMGKYVPQLEVLDVLLGDKPVLSPPVRVYQRLLAGDDDDATELAQNYLKEMSLEEVYDRVLVPALADAERDWHRGNLDEARHRSIRQGLRDIVIALGDEQRDTDASAAADRTVREAKGNVLADSGAPAERSSDILAAPDTSDRVKVLCLAAHDEADEIVGVMLAQLLQRRGYDVDALGAASLTSEMVDLAARDRADVVLVSAMPPKAALHARYLLKQLSSRHPELKVILGVWGNSKQANAVDAAHAASDARVVTTLAEAREELAQFALTLVVPRA
jgi:methylmalonyl-CoA mutase cobalamin-binding subunit